MGWQLRLSLSVGNAGTSPWPLIFGRMSIPMYRAEQLAGSPLRGSFLPRGMIVSCKEVDNITGFVKVQNLFLVWPDPPVASSYSYK